MNSRLLAENELRIKKSSKTYKKERKKERRKKKQKESLIKKKKIQKNLEKTYKITYKIANNLPVKLPIYETTVKKCYQVYCSYVPRNNPPTYEKLSTNAKNLANEPTQKIETSYVIQIVTAEKTKKNKPNHIYKNQSNLQFKITYYIHNQFYIFTQINYKLFYYQFILIIIIHNIYKYLQLFIQTYNQLIYKNEQEKTKKNGKLFNERNGIMNYMKQNATFQNKKMPYFKFLILDNLHYIARQVNKASARYLNKTRKTNILSNRLSRVKTTTNILATIKENPKRLMQSQPVTQLGHTDIRLSTKKLAGPQGNAFLPHRYELLPLASEELITLGNNPLLSKYEKISLPTYICLIPGKVLYYYCSTHSGLHKIGTVTDKFVTTSPLTRLSTATTSKPVPLVKSAAATAPPSPPRSRPGRRPTSPTTNPDRLLRSL